MFIEAHVPVVKFTSAQLKQQEKRKTTNLISKVHLPGSRLKIKLLEIGILKLDANINCDFSLP